jgi:hypothetical protein
MWFKVRPNYVLHWPEYGPYFGDAVGMVPPLVARADRAWALEGHYVEVDHPAIKWCLEGINQQMHKLVQVSDDEVSGLSAVAAKRVRLSSERPPPIKRLIDEWNRRVADAAPPTPESEAASTLEAAGVETMSGGGEVPALDDSEDENAAVAAEEGSDG